MPHFPKPSFKRSSFGNKKSGFDRGPKQMFKATCSTCGNACEVPFRPNGRKPVQCNNCFVRKDSPRSPREDSVSRPAFSDLPSPRPDQAFNDLKAELRGVNNKLERLIALMTLSTEKVTRKKTSKSL